MDADGVGNDEFQACQADAIVGQLRKIKCQLRITHVHGNLHRNAWHVVERDGLYFKTNLAAINIAGVTLAAAHCQIFTFANDIGRVLAADHGWNPEFAGDDRCMTGASAAIGHDRRRTFHYRLPIRVGHIGDDDVSIPEQADLGHILDHACRALAHLAANGTAFGDLCTLRRHAITCQRICFCFLRFHRFGARLQNVQLAVAAVPAPFNIHRATVMRLDCHCIPGKLFSFRIGERKTLALGRGNRLRFHRLSCRLGRTKNHLFCFGTQSAPQHSRFSVLQTQFRDIEFIRINCTLYHHFAQAIAGRNEHHIAKT